MAHYLLKSTFSGMPAVFGDLAAIEQASETELKEIARQIGTDTND